eukprot:CAMPEP_0116910078 /NCGR_PEP_ID=MMETSP0467-20121206/14660_1 /TAXON_ID=283647 /ORGANISM="Mesodinium pulex, Strain SPMC105" /LENGTH=36 /DNA_ID= /DNA_START= /DNA_END= /DNA_ORIENTATION=
MTNAEMESDPNESVNDYHRIPKSLLAPTNITRKLIP